MTEAKPGITEDNVSGADGEMPETPTVGGADNEELIASMMDELAGRGLITFERPLDR
jgi:hypothetical protein